MSTDYTPTPEAVERLVREAEAAGETLMMRSEARFILTRQHAREADAKLALRYLAELGGGNSEGNIYARRALERWERLDAPPEPTLLEAFKLAEASRFVDDSEPDVHIRKSAWDALKAAVERAERAR